MPKLQDIDTAFAARVLSALYPDGLRVDDYQNAIKGMIGLAGLAGQFGNGATNGHSNGVTSSYVATAEPALLPPATSWKREGDKKYQGPAAGFGKLTDGQRVAVLKHLSEKHGPMNASEFAKHVQVGNSTALVWFQEAEKAGLIKSIGKQMKRYYAGTLK